MKKLAVLSLLLVLATPLLAKDAAPLAEDPVVEQRMVKITEELRCLVCQNESLSGSHADLANDLRREIRGLIKAGKSDSEIMDFMVSRYGDFVRYRPPLKGITLLLWFGPAALLLLGIIVLIRYLRRRDSTVAGQRAISAEEAARAEALLNAGAAPVTSDRKDSNA